VAVESLAEQERLLLVEATQRLTRCLEPARVIREVLQLMSELIGLNRGRVVQPDPVDPATLVITHAYGLTRTEMERGRYGFDEGVTSRVMRTGVGAIVQDLDAEPAFLFRAVRREVLPAGTVSFLAVPVMGVHGQLGVLGVHRLRARPRPLASDMTLLRAMAALIGQMLQVNRLIAERTAVLEQENHRLRHALHANVTVRANPAGIVGSSAALRQALHQIEQVAAADVTVLLLGESGTGKEMFARALHLQSPRCAGPFVKINCGAIPENLFESELFGHERGAYTGANVARAGRFEQANGGTLFLDEIGDLPLAMQVKLLRVLQERTVERLGGQGREIAVDVRLVAATHHDLHRLVEQGLFRADLMYRLNVIPVHLPPLRERRDDLAELVLHFVSRLNQTHQRNVSVGPAALALLCGHAWPGNIRQLANVLERLVLLSRDGELPGPLVARALAAEAAQSSSTPAPTPAPAPEPPGAMVATAPAPASGAQASARTATAMRPYEWVRSEDRDAIEAALLRSGGNRARAARDLGLTPRQLAYRLT
jgi:Nif-specific regulatory protein